MVDAYPCKTYDQIYSNQFYHHPLLFWLLTEFPKCVTILYIYYKKDISRTMCHNSCNRQDLVLVYSLKGALCKKQEMSLLSDFFRFF